MWLGQGNWRKLNKNFLLVNKLCNLPVHNPKKGPRKEKLIYMYRQPGRKIQKWQSLLVYCKFLISKEYVNTLTINTYSR